MKKTIEIFNKEISDEIVPNIRIGFKTYPMFSEVGNVAELLGILDKKVIISNKKLKTKKLITKLYKHHLYPLTLVRYIDSVQNRRIRLCREELENIFKTIPEIIYVYEK